MIRIAVVEDEAAQAETLRDMLLRYGEETGTRLSVSMFSDGEDFVSKYDVYDIAFLDIQLQHMDGIRAAEAIRRKDEQILLIFVTNLAHYAIQGYAVNAMTFLLKPISYAVLAEKMEQALRRLEHGRSQFVTVRTLEGFMKFAVSDIQYVEILSRRLTLHTVQGEFHTTESMVNMEAKLTGAGFFRCHVAYLVNLEYVSRIDHDFAIVAERRVLVSKYRKKEFLQALTNYVGGII